MQINNSLTNLLGRSVIIKSHYINSYIGYKAEIVNIHFNDNNSFTVDIILSIHYQDENHTEFNGMLLCGINPKDLTFYSFGQ